ncbi:MAG: hypothetical protein R2694_16090 [Ilumatobacteraceae bacterium]
MPLHLVGQQVLALALQEGQVGRHTWQGWLGTPFKLAWQPPTTPPRSSPT